MLLFGPTGIVGILNVVAVQIAEVHVDAAVGRVRPALEDRLDALAHVVLEVVRVLGCCAPGPAARARHRTARRPPSEVRMMTRAIRSWLLLLLLLLADVGDCCAASCARPAASCTPPRSARSSRSRRSPSRRSSAGRRRPSSSDRCARIGRRVVVPRMLCRIVPAGHQRLRIVGVVVGEMPVVVEVRAVDRSRSPFACPTSGRSARGTGACRGCACAAGTRAAAPACGESCSRRCAPRCPPECRAASSAARAAATSGCTSARSPSDRA